MRHIVVFLALLLLSPLTATAEPPQLVIGSDGAAVLRETFTVELDAGAQVISRSLPATVQAGSVLLRETGAQPPARIVLQEVLVGNPDSASYKPCPVRWALDVPAAGGRTFELTCVVLGLEWEGRHTLEITPEGDKASYQGALRVVNETFHDFADVRVSVTKIPLNFASDKNRSLPPARFSNSDLSPLSGITALPPGASVSLLLASLPAFPLTLQANFLFVREKDSPVEIPDGNFATWMAEWENTEGNGLGIPLPGGMVMIYQALESGPYLLNAISQGQRGMGSIPPGGKFSYPVGSEPGITLEKTEVQTQSEKFGETVVLTLRSTLKEPREVRVVNLIRLSIPRGPRPPRPVRPSRGQPEEEKKEEAEIKYTVTDASDPYTIREADQRIEFMITLKPGEEREIKYTNTEL